MKEYWEDVPGFFDFQDVYTDAVNEAKNGDTLVEVGTLFGKSALFMAQRVKESGKRLTFYVVDKWDEGDIVYLDVTGNMCKDMIHQYGSMMGAFAYHLKQSGLREYIKVLRMDSAQAASLIAPDIRALSFVFIDADHSYEGCTRDLHAWELASVMAGHDYVAYPSVRKAVDDFFNGRSEVETVGGSWRVR